MPATPEMSPKQAAQAWHRKSLRGAHICPECERATALRFQWRVPTYLIDYHCHECDHDWTVFTVPGGAMVSVSAGDVAVPICGGHLQSVLRSNPAEVTRAQVDSCEVCDIVFADAQEGEEVEQQ